MNHRCTYCNQELDAQEAHLLFHTTCLTELFGENTPLNSDNITVRRAEDNYDPQAEALTFSLSKAAMILSEPSSLFRTQSGELALAKARSNSPETIAQAVENWEGCEFDNTVEMLAELIEEFSSIARLDIVNLYEQLLFGWIMGCNSMSLDSFALSHPHAGLSSLSPLYDLNPTLLSQEEQSPIEFAMSINGKRKAIRRSDFEASMRYMGLKDRIIRITIEKMVSAQEAWVKIIEESELSPEFQAKFIGLIKKRMNTLRVKS